jgi:F-type H+-transporting ATPase subunit b
MTRARLYVMLPVRARVAAALLVLTIAAAVPFGAAAIVEAQQPEAAKPAETRAPHGAPAGHEPAQGEEAHDEGWLPVIAKTVNFAILAGVLVYFLKTPLTEYLSSRIVKVRQDLVTAAETREAATRQLSDIHAKLAALPGELDALKQRGADEIAAERVRIQQAAEAERQRLLEHARREIDMRLRVARRELLDHAATLAVAVASERIKRSITPDDQARLVERYTSQLAEVGA